MKLKLTALTAAGVIALTSIVYAHGGATGIVKERMDLMGAIGKNMKAIAAMVKGEAEFDAAAISKAAASISDHSTKINGLFPKDSLMKPTEALPSIWQDWDTFSKLSDDLVVQAGKLSETAKGGDKRAIMMEFAKTGKLCSACHTDFRLKKE